MDDQELSQLELYCKQLYESPDPSARGAAEKALILFSNSPDCLRKCQYLLERAASSYSQLLAASTLSKLIIKATSVLPVAERINIRNYILNYFITRPKLAPFVVQALAQLLAKLTKFGWFDTQDDTYVFRSITDDIGQFLQGSIEHCIIGIKILAEIVSLINQTESTLSISKYRKISASFRDAALYDIFTMCLTMLKQISNKRIDFQNQQQISLIKELLQLVKNCLAYDFIGTSFDESTDDMGTVHIPTQWKQLFLDFSNIHLFLDLYQAVPQSISSMAMVCYVQLASVRRSLFDPTERAKYLQELLNGAKRILESPQSLEDLDNYHEFCRFLARVKSNYQLGEIIKTENYREFIEMIAKFTVTSLQMWQFAPNSVYYLMNMWQKMVASCPFVKANEPHYLDRFTPQITEAFVTAKLQSVADVLRDNLDDPLEDKSTLHQQLDQISTIGRCEYSKTCSLLISLFDQTAQSYQALLQSNGSMTNDITIQEGRLTWLVFMIGYSIGGRISFSATEEHDAFDAELCTRVLTLMNLTDSKLSQGRISARFEFGLLSFFEQFKKIYIGDQVNKSSKVYQILSERLGIADETAMLGVFVGKIITNMKYWARNERIINSTLQLLSDLSIGYSSARKLVKLAPIQFILNNHTPEHFPFLGFQADCNFKCRTLFYTAIGRLLLVDLGDEEERFLSFARPLTAALDDLANRIATAGANSYQMEETKQYVVGLSRDLRGLAFSFNTKSSYLHFFNWLYPKFAAVFQRSLELWPHEPVISTTLLKLMTELTQNRSQRLLFDVMSPNGVLLFREISKTIMIYGRSILNLNAVPEDQIYTLKYKGIAISFDMLKAALAGNYINFGVMQLYGDDALNDALAMFVKIVMSIPQQDLLEYPKLSQSFYGLLEIITENHIDHLCEIDPQVFLYVLSSVSQGLDALDPSISTGCCATLDHIVTYLFQQLQKASKSSDAQKEVEKHPALKVIEMQPNILKQMLSTILNTVMFEDCKNMWSMSRPLLGLILLNEEFFTELERNITQMQTPDKQPRMAECFQDLMENVERSMTTKNRDRFTQNLSTFRSCVKSITSSAPASSSSSAIEMMGYDM
ncbi:exportin-7-like [Rhopilema esculentum]|uniref:exportin-7-like n=1 Tax=Rhopilema esculentum TaxID=499914 RepID=UPI0031D080AB